MSIRGCAGESLAQAAVSDNALLLVAGFAWLTVAKNGSLAVEATPNQDNPMSKGLGYSGNTPILGLDVVRLLPLQSTPAHPPPVLCPACSTHAVVLLLGHAS